MNKYFFTFLYCMVERHYLFAAVSQALDFKKILESTMLRLSLRLQNASVRCNRTTSKAIREKQPAETEIADHSVNPSVVTQYLTDRNFVTRFQI
jgi:hypothetical protein